MQDAPGAKDWMHKCLENRPIEIQNVYDRIVYNRTDSPWPVWDRDVAVQTRGRIDIARKRILIEMNSIATHGNRKSKVLFVSHASQVTMFYVM